MDLVDMALQYGGFNHKGYLIEIAPDQDAEPPLEEGVRVVGFGRHGTRHPWKSPADVEDYAKREKAALVPLWAYIHSGMVLSTRPFSDPWDSGFYGFLLIEARAVKQWGLEDREKLEEFAQQEVEAYNQWLRGDVWSYSVERRGEIVDSLCGIYGLEEAVRMAVEAVEQTGKETQ